MADVRGMIAVDKIGCKILFLNPRTYATETVLEGFQRTVHELLVVPETGRAYVPIFGDGIHGRNPNPGHQLWVIDLLNRKLVTDIDLRPLSAPHTVRLGPDGLVYITCENSAKVAVINPKTNTVIDAIDSGSTNGHRLCISNDGKRLYTDNEEDATVSVIDLPARKLLGKIATPQPIAGVGISGDGKTVVAVSDVDPVIYMIDAAAGKVTQTVRLDGAEKPAQIVRYSPDDRLIVVSNLNNNMLHVIDVKSGAQSAIPLGSQPMDFAFRNGEIVIGCQGDGSMHVIDVASRTVTKSFQAGTGCESVGFF